MDEEMRRYLDGMMGQVNTKLDDILDKLSAVRSDTDGVKGHVVYLLSDSLTLSQRITKLEDQLRRGREA